MAQDVTFKEQSFVSRYSATDVDLIHVIDKLTSLKAEWDANGFATGAPAVSGTNWNIGDTNVQAVLPGATAAMLNSAVGAVESIRTTYNTNVGYLTVMRP